MTTLLEEKRRLRAEAEEQAQKQAMQDLEDSIPKPTGYHVLVAVPQVKATFGDSEIIKADTTMQAESILTMTGRVIDVGRDAYKDESRYPSGPWCKVGDYVLFRANTGTRFRIGESEFRMMNEDSIQGVVPDPDAIQRVGA